jgi:hypothetical protein
MRKKITLTAFCGLLVVVTAFAQVVEQVAKLTSDDDEYHGYFGFSVSVSGDTAIVGTDREQTPTGFRGAASIFQRDQSDPGNWSRVAKIYTDEGGSFGRSVSVSGDTVVVGGRSTGTVSGSAYVFQRDQGGPGNWGQVAKLTADGTAYDGFGRSVSISGDTIIMGAYEDHYVGQASGSAYIFQRHQGGPDNWGQAAKVAADDVMAEDGFGWSASVSGDTAIVGTRDSDSAYIFQRDQGGLDHWGQVAKLSYDGNARTGESVSIHGDTVVVGDPGRGVDGVGAAYIFERDQGGQDTWGQVARVTADDTERGDLLFFGRSVSISGDTVIVGSSVDDDAPFGFAYIFQRDRGGPDNWRQVVRLAAPSGYSSFGYAVSVSDGTAIVGEPYDNNGGDDVTGSAYVFHIDSARIGSARTLKEGAVDLLRTLPGTGHNEADNDIEDAIASIEASLEEKLWLGDYELFYNEIYVTHGKEVFDQERAAARSLEDVLAHSELDAGFLAAANGAVGYLVLADDHLARAALNDAYAALDAVDCSENECNCDDATDDVNDSESSLTRAQDHVLDDDDGSDAIYDYQKAWSSANRSLYETGWCMAKLGSDSQTTAEGALAAAMTAAVAAGCDLDGPNTDNGDCRCVKAVDNIDDAEVHLAQGLDKLADGDLDMAEYRFRQTFDDTVKVHDAVHWCE